MNPSDTIQQFEQYLERRAPGRRTAANYVSDVRQFAQMCAKPWREVTLHDIDGFVDQQRQAGYSRATVKRRVAALKVFFDFLAEESGDLAWPNPVRFKRHAGKPAKHLPRDLTDEQVERLWAVIDEPRDRAWFALMLRGGLRVGEVTGLTCDDVLRPAQADQPARLRVLGKGQKERVVLLTADAYAVLQAWLAQRPASEQGALFLNERGGPLLANGIEWLLHRYGERVDLKVTPHQLRHTYGRELTEAGMPITSLSKLMGHADLQTTQIYTDGADPALCQAYQDAMARLSALPAIPPATQESSPPAVQGVEGAQGAEEEKSPPGVESRAPVETAPPVIPHPSQPPQPPDWDHWATHLPEPLRQACLAFVQRRWPTWKPSRRREDALNVLGELRRFLEWQIARRPVTAWSEVRLADLRAYQQARGIEGRRATTINATLKAVLGVLREQAEAAETGTAVDASVFRLKHLPRPDNLPRALKESEFGALEHSMTQRLEALPQGGDPLARLENACYFVLAHGGLRANELLDLRGQDVDLAGRRVWVRQGKGQRDRVVYLSDTAVRALADYVARAPLYRDAPVWRLANGQSIHYSWLKRHVAALGEAAGVEELTAHRLRHTLATRLLNAGMDITRIQKLLGHDHIQTTMIYARVEDPVVETDYRRAMSRIERASMPLSTTPVPAEGWPTEQPAQMPAAKEALDNSV